MNNSMCFIHSDCQMTERGTKWMLTLMQSHVSFFFFFFVSCYYCFWICCNPRGELEIVTKTIGSISNKVKWAFTMAGHVGKNNNHNNVWKDDGAAAKPWQLKKNKIATSKNTRPVLNGTEQKKKKSNVEANIEGNTRERIELVLVCSTFARRINKCKCDSTILCTIRVQMTTAARTKTIQHIPFTCFALFLSVRLSFSILLPLFFFSVSFACILKLIENEAANPQNYNWIELNA